MVYIRTPFETVLYSDRNDGYTDWFDNLQSTNTCWWPSHGHYLSVHTWVYPDYYNTWVTKPYWPRVGQNDT